MKKDYLNSVPVSERKRGAIQTRNEMILVVLFSLVMVFAIGTVAHFTFSDYIIY